MSACHDCPRACGTDRERGERGYCGCGALPRAARAAAHYGEEPCISGERGSGTVFFTGCSLGCAYCQNADISLPGAPVSGRELSVPELRDTLLRLRDTGVHNINLVTGTHYITPIARALDGLELGIPVVWNSSGYESVEALRRLEGLVQIYMPDFKYSERECAAKYSNAPDYPEVCAGAIMEMFRQTGPYRVDDADMLQSGVLIRHLILPGWTQNSVGVIDWVAGHFPMGGVLFSLMSQYTPMPGIEKRFPELARPVTRTTAAFLYDYLIDRGIEDGYYQEPDASGDAMIPAWDMTGL